MVSRPYVCPLCSSAFRNESGMKWHLAHRHEIPAAFDALGKDYQEEIKKLSEGEALAENKLKQLETKLEQTMLDLIKQHQENLQIYAEKIKLNQDIQILAMELAFRNFLIKEKLGIEVPYISNNIP